MEIEKKTEGSKLTVSVTGHIDTVTAPQLEAELVLDAVDELVLDLSGVAYVSSAGLRVFLSAYKAMSKKGGMTIVDRKSTRLNSSHPTTSRMPSSA